MSLNKTPFYLVLAEISADVFQFLQNPTAFFSKKNHLEPVFIYVRKKSMIFLDPWGLFRQKSTSKIRSYLGGGLFKVGIKGHIVEFFFENK